MGGTGEDPLTSTEDREHGAAPDTPPVDDGVWEITLGGLLLPLAVTLDQGRMPVLVILAVPVVAALVRWRITRPRVGPDVFRRQLGALKLGPMGLLCLLVLVGAVVIGAMARDGREAFEPARSAAPGIAAAGVLALSVLAGLLAARLRAARFVAWAGLAVVGLLLEPIAGPRPRALVLGVLSLVIAGFGLVQLWRFVRGQPRLVGPPRDT